jgi:hypothetical protein
LDHFPNISLLGKESEESEEIKEREREREKARTKRETFVGILPEVWQQRERIRSALSSVVQSILEVL